jgi:diguanylate cyclase (GGDEF)-like protein
LLAGAAYFVINNLLAGTASALWLSLPVSTCLRSDFGFQALTAAVFLSLAPVIVVVADFDLALIVMLVLPLLAIWKVERDAMSNEHQALHDSLTGLPNRVLFADRVRQKVIDNNREVSTFAVMLMDLDHFKEINDTLGHHHGDMLLQQVAIRLRGALRESDTVARMGGDEFAILLSRVSDADAAGRVAEKLLDALHQPFQVEGLTLEVGASIGIAAYPDHGDDLDTLLQRADVAMFVAKEARNGYEFYSAESDNHSPDRLALAGEMRRAIDAGDIGLYYQPTVDLRNGRVVSAEGLARWTHPERGLIPPMEFIPIAEQTGLIRPLTMRLLKDAMEEVRRWHSEGFQLSVSVNISPRHLLDQQLPQDIARLLRESDVAPGWLKLEITESTMLADPRQADARRAERVLGTLHSMGVKMSIDDFGTGHSSFAYLKRLPVDEIKIDRSFVMNMSESASDAFIVNSTIDLGRNLGLGVVAEGVETQGITDDLVALACDRAQGYHFCRPLPPAEFVEWIRGYQASSVSTGKSLAAIAPAAAPRVGLAESRGAAYG